MNTGRLCDRSRGRRLAVRRVVGRGGDGRIVVAGVGDGRIVVGAVGWRLCVCVLGGSGGGGLLLFYLCVIYVSRYLLNLRYLLLQ